MVITGTDHLEIGTYYSDGNHYTSQGSAEPGNIGYMNIKNVDFDSYSYDQAYIDVQVDSFRSSWDDGYAHPESDRRTTYKTDFKFYYTINHSLYTNYTALMESDYNYSMIDNAINDGSLNDLFTLTLDHRYSSGYLSRNYSGWFQMI